MKIHHAEYTFSRKTNLPFEEAVEEIRSRLQDAGYQVRSKSSLQAELPLHLRVWCEQPYAVLEAQVPSPAREGHGIDSRLEDIVPCKVVVCEREGKTRVAATMHERIPPVIDIVEEISRRG